MMEMLKKFEEQASEQKLDEEEDEEEMSDLAERFGTIDLGASKLILGRRPSNSNPSF